MVSCTVCFKFKEQPCFVKLSSPRLITDVDFYTWFSGYGKWWTYSMRTSKFYCRLSLLVTFEWLLVKHLHKELDVQQRKMAAASLCAAWAWPRPMQKGRGSHPTTLHFCLPSAGVAKQLPSLTVLFLPFPFSSLTCSLGFFEVCCFLWMCAGDGSQLSLPFFFPWLQNSWLNVLRFALSVCDRCFNTPSGNKTFGSVGGL